MDISYQLLNHKNCFEKISNASKVVFFCGSGISIFKPSEIIGGWAIKNSINKKITDKKNEFGLDHINSNDLINLPLETILDINFYTMHDGPDKKSLEKIQDYFSNITPNKIHYFIASYLYFHDQVSVITTNYDVGIEKALESISQKLGNPKRKTSIYAIKNANKITKAVYPSIYKIHGCSIKDDASDLVLTTRQESSAFTFDFKNVIGNIFQNSLVVFMGYSFSEPDCFEMLFDQSNFDLLWFCRYEEDLDNTSRLSVLFERAQERFVVEDLKPIIDDPFEDKVDFLPITNNVNNVLDVINSTISSTGTSKFPYKNKVNGEELFISNFENLEKEPFIKGLLVGFLQARSFSEVNEILEIYKTIPTANMYFYYFTLASITRDLNNDWGAAMNLFRASQLTNDASLLDIYSAKIEELGLKTLLSQNNKNDLVSVEEDLRILANEIEIQLAASDKDQGQLYLRLLGRTYKNIVQNITYQKGQNINRIDEAIGIINQAILNLESSKEIHPRVESERFKGRLFYRRYIKNKDRADLDQAIYLTKKTHFLFSMLEGQMGKINASRQYIHYLIKAGDLLKAEKELNRLEKDIIGSDDRLSFQKLFFLKTLLAIKKKNVVEMVISVTKFFLSTISTPWNKNPPMNTLRAMKWLKKYLKGMAG